MQQQIQQINQLDQLQTLMEVAENREETIDVNRVIELESIFEKYNKTAEQYVISIDKGEYWHYAPEALKEILEIVKKQLQELESFDEEYREQFFCMGDSHPQYEKYRKKIESVIEKLNAIIETKTKNVGGKNG